MGLYAPSFFMEVIMAYQGYLIKVGNYNIPMKFIKADSYNASLITQDLDSYRDMDGVLHRTALLHRVNKIEFETPSLLKNNEMKEFLGNLRQNYINANEKKVNATVYVPELDDYMEQEMYIPDLNFSIFGIFNGVIFYNPLRVAFIAY